MATTASGSRGRLRASRLATRITARADLALAVLAGAALPLAFAPFDWFFVAPVSYAVLFLLWKGAAPKRAALLGFAYGLASFFAGLYWIYISIHEFGLVHPALALLLTAGLVAILAMFPAVTGWLAARVSATTGAAAWLGLLPALWALTEWCRGWAFSGFGWLSAGYSQTESWLMGLAPVGGLHAMSWAVVLSAGALVTLALGGRGQRIAALAALAVLWGGAYAAGGQRWTQPKGELLSVALVQGAVPQELKWRPEQLEATLGLYGRLTEQALGSRLIVWPEAAIPTLYEYIDGYFDGIERRASAADSTVLVGVLRGTPEDFENSLISLTAPQQVYTKRHLVPFGEYFPVPSFIREWLRLMSLPYVDAAPGPAEQPPLDVVGERIAVTICYEDVFGAEQLHSLPDATLLVNVSNDAWFGDSIAPHQHLQIAQLRAAEAGRYLLRSTNTGITAVIDSGGRVVSRIPQFEPGVLKDTVQGFTGATPYARWGNYPVVIGAFAVVVLVAARQRPSTKFRMRPGT